MTIEEMRQKLHEFCEEQYDCNGCDLSGDTCRCGRGAYFIDFEPNEDGYMTDDEIRLAYGLVFPTPTADEEPHIRDSGTRQEFKTGAVRDIQKGKGRCDLMPLDVAAGMMGGREDGKVRDSILHDIARFQKDGDVGHLYHAIRIFTQVRCGSICTMLLDVSKHFEEGAEKYGENNWQKGLPVKCYINSAVRHYLKYQRGDKDENHDLAFCWNLMCALWTCEHKPELNDYGLKECPVCAEPLPREVKFCDNCKVTMKPDFDPDEFLCEHEEEW